jgi:hypothetical protein
VRNALTAVPELARTPGGSPGDSSVEEHRREPPGIGHVARALEYEIPTDIPDTGASFP